MSIVYANKGDFFGAAGEGEEHFNRDGEKLPDPGSLTEAMERDVGFIQESLTGVLGEPERQTFGGQTQSPPRSTRDRPFLGPVGSLPGDCL